MRPKLPDKEKRNAKLIIWVSIEEKQRISILTKTGRFPLMSDFIRSRIFKRNDKKVYTFNDETKFQFQKLDWELNKIGVNLNQLSKRLNSHPYSEFGDNDRALLRQSFNKMSECLAYLQKYFR